MIQAQWYELEARRRGIAIPDTNVGARAASEHSGVDLEYLVPVDRALLLRSLVQPKPTGFAGTGQTEISRYYAAHRERYMTEDERLIEAIRVPTWPDAKQVAAQLREGRTPAQIVRSGESDGVTIASEEAQPPAFVGGPRLQRVARRVHQTGVGMLKDPRGWLVFRVAVARPPEQQPLEQVASNVAEELATESLRRHVEVYNARLRSRYRDLTTCADGFELPDCL